ncbi:MAG: Na+/H+ antiporter NhaA, partial [Flavobacterium sp.]
MKLTKTFKAFFGSGKAGGLVLLFVTILSLILANSSIQTEYIAFWKM